MVPDSYALQTVTARLVERLEGARRTYGDRDGEALAAFEQAAREHVDAAIAEFQAVALEEPGAHTAFLRREVMNTALPRFHQLAMGMNRAEAAGFGFGWLATPAGRFALLAAAVLACTFLGRMVGSPITWPLLLAAVTLPLWPTFAAGMVRRRYVAEVEELVDDMARIQAAERTYLREGQLRAAAELTVDPPRPPPERERT